MSYLLSLDTEGGGISHNYSLLSLTLSVVDPVTYEQIETLSLKLKPDNDSGYFVQGKALDVNKINILEHDKVAITYKDSKSEIYNWLVKQKTKYGKLVPFGNNFQRDIDIITRYTISYDSWTNFVKKFGIELTVLGVELKQLEVIPEEQSLALSKIAEFMSIKVDESKLHDDTYDVELGCLVLKGYRELFKKCYTSS